MPKMKTHRGAAKRFKITASGKVKRVKTGKSHLLSKKSSKRKRYLRKEEKVSPSFKKKVRRMLGV